MKRNPFISRRKGERGIVILIVAVFLLFVVGVMAALAIDLVSFYTARNEAQLAADAGALAGARVMANSGSTSNPNNALLEANAQNLAIAVAKRVAIQNKVGGRTLLPAEVAVSFPPSPGGASNPKVAVRVTRNDVPTFFARMFGQTQTTVSATATAEAYNTSRSAAANPDPTPIAPICLKPMILPNLNPRNPGTPIFDRNTGMIQDPALLGYNAKPLTFSCASDDCASLGTPTDWQYYPGSQASFPAPTQSVPACAQTLNSYQVSIAGCVPIPIACGDGSAFSSTIAIDQVAYAPNGANRTADTAAAVNCLTHSASNNGDRVNTAVSPPFQFTAGSDNPVTAANGIDVLVSDSLVTIPVFDSAVWPPPSSPNVQVIGFLQLFLNPDGTAAAGPINATVINMVGCGTDATGQPILGNGASAVPVRLVAP